MGCAKSTQNGGGDREKGNKQGDEKSQQVQSDPRLPLTAKQKYNLVASWKGISRAMEPTGITMFLKLFLEEELFKAKYNFYMSNGTSPFRLFEIGLDKSNTWIGAERGEGWG
ncbi:hypothetical protein RUM44_004618 [Polyplax serrata]|uniref:Uncharacterized protein n=1 Tax=Polyplax serrata TaxID=468196 RepID=A0ABR1B3C5_POLSC